MFKIRRLTYFSIDDDEEPEPREESEPKENDIKSNSILRDVSSKMLDKLNSEHFSNQNSWFKKSLVWLCGIESFINIEKNEQHNQNDSKIDTSIDQDPKWKTICDVNAVVAMALCGFCYAFFNKYD
jgi:hypothetical protein